jgi:hypothetical protein
MELADSHKLRLPAPLSRLLHIVPQPELDRQVKAKAFDTVATCGDDEKIEALGLPKLYVHKADVEDCAVFWGKKP